jgi:hypothetical protein
MQAHCGPLRVAGLPLWVRWHLRLWLGQPANSVLVRAGDYVVVCRMPLLLGALLLPQHSPYGPHAHMLLLLLPSCGVGLTRTKGVWPEHHFAALIRQPSTHLPLALELAGIHLLPSNP